MTRHVAVWIDHREARIFHIERDGVEAETVAAPLHNIHRKHPRGAEGVREHPEDAKRFFHDIARGLEGSDAILIVGPSTAKLELIRYFHEREHALDAKVVGVETVDHPTDGQVVAYAKKYFKRTDAIPPSSAR